MTAIILRILSSIALVYFVYKETGWATAICIGLIFISIELISWGIGELIEINKQILELIK
jgi:hypothetical protein